MILGALVLLLTGGSPYAAGWLWGSMGNIGYFLFLALRVRKVSTLPPAEAAQKIKLSLAGRLALIVLVILAAAWIPGMKMITVLAGLLMLKPIIYLDHIFGSR